MSQQAAPHQSRYDTRPLPLSVKAGWGIADLGVNIFVIIKQLIILNFLVQYLGVPAGIAGLMTMAVLLFDIVTDPIIGWLSDRTQSRFGRRLPWIAVGGLLLAVLTIVMFAVPAAMTGVTAGLWVMAFFALATIAFTMVVVPYGAMSAEMTRDPKERSSLVAYRMASSSFGILLAGAVFPLLHGGTRAGHLFAASIFAVIMLSVIWLSVYACRKAPRIDQLSNQGTSSEGASKEGPGSEGPITQLRTTLNNRAFVVLLVTYGIQTFGIALIMAGIPFAAGTIVTNQNSSFLFGLTQTVGGVQPMMFALFVIGSIISQPVWAMLSNVFGKRPVFIVGSAINALVLLALFFFMPTTSMGSLGLITLLFGFVTGCFQQLPWAMLPDLIDITSREEGKDQAGAFNAVWLFGQKAANALAPGCLGILIGVFGWQESTGGAIDQTEAAKSSLVWAMTVIPAIFLALSVPAYLVGLKRFATGSK